MLNGTTELNPCRFDTYRVGQKTRVQAGYLVLKYVTVQIATIANVLSDNTAEEYKTLGNAWDYESTLAPVNALRTVQVKQHLSLVQPTCVALGS